MAGRIIKIRPAVFRFNAFPPLLPACSERQGWYDFLASSLESGRAGKGGSMNQEIDQPTPRLGLLANGSSRRWDVAVDEPLDGDEWSLELDGPQTYLVFQLRDLKVISEAVRFLQSRPSSDPASRRDEEADVAELTLGRFGSAAVSLIWDNEDFPRCFLVIGPKARSTLRLSLDAEDIRMLSEALRQVMNDLPQPAGD